MNPDLSYDARPQELTERKQLGDAKKTPPLFTPKVLSCFLHGNSWRPSRPPL